MNPRVEARVTRWISRKYRTVPVSLSQNIELFIHALSGIIFTPDKEPKYRKVRLNSRHLATIVEAGLTGEVYRYYIGLHSVFLLFSQSQFDHYIHFCIYVLC